jgi:hypothetical protein
VEEVPEASSAVNSASFVPDWTVSAHVWRAADMMAAFDLSPRCSNAYFAVVNHCKAPNFTELRHLYASIVHICNQILIMCCLDLTIIAPVINQCACHNGRFE